MDSHNVWPSEIGSLLCSITPSRPVQVGADSDCSCGILCGHPPVVMFFFLQSAPCLLVAGLMLSLSPGSAFRRLGHALGEHSHHFPWHHRPGHVGRRALPCRMGPTEPSSLCSQVTSGCGAGQRGRFSPARSQTQTPFSPQPRTVLELGSGAGLTGLAICKTCRPSAYIFSDCHSCVLEQLRGNILLNGLSLEADATDHARHPGHNTCDSESPRVSVAQLDWDVVTASQLAAFQPDVVIAAGTDPHPWMTSSSPKLSALERGQWVLPGQTKDEIFIRAVVGLGGDIKA